MIAIGCDHGGYELKLEIMKKLTEMGVILEDTRAGVKWHLA